MVDWGLSRPCLDLTTHVCEAAYSATPIFNESYTFSSKSFFFKVIVTVKENRPREFFLFLSWLSIFSQSEKTALLVDRYHFLSAFKPGRKCHWINLRWTLIYLLATGGLSDSHLFPPPSRHDFWLPAACLRSRGGEGFFTPASALNKERNLLESCALFGKCRPFYLTGAEEWWSRFNLESPLSKDGWAFLKCGWLWVEGTGWASSSMNAICM